jgi:hypothetical protein
MKKFVITEEEKDDILGQHSDMKPKPPLPENRRILDIDLDSMKISRYKTQGLTPYYFDDKLMEMVEIKQPVKKDNYHKPKEVFLLTTDEYDKIKKLSDNIKEMIELKLKQIKLYKQYIPAVMGEIIKKK